MSQTAETENPLAAILDFEKSADAENRAELRARFIEAVVDLAHGRDVPDATDFLQWGIQAEAFTETEVRQLVGRARAILRDIPIADEYDARQKEATKAAENFIKVRDERMAALKAAADKRTLAENARATAAQAIQRIEAARRELPELFNADGSFKQPSK